VHESSGGHLRIVVCLRTTAVTHGGPVKSVIELIDSLHQRGHTVTLLTADASGVPAGWHREGGPTVVCVRAWLRGRGPIRSSELRRVKACVGQVDIVHLNEIWELMNVQIAQIARRLNVPYVVSPRGSLSPWPLSHKPIRKWLFARSFGRTFLRDVSSFHFTAEDERMQASRAAPIKDSFVAPNLLNLTPYAMRWDADLLKGKLAIDRDDVVLLFMGRLVPNKGLEYVIRAMPAIQENFPKVKLVVAGSGDVHGAKQLASALRVSGAVIFTGFVDGELKRSVLARSALLLLPSRSENFANVLFEAAACGTRSIISRHVNTWRELVGAGVSSLAELSPKAIQVRVIEDLQRPDQERRTLDQAAMHWAHSFYASNRVVTLYETAYRSIKARARS
jgi:glycosyltransferase involved in cell wall biosynthesis